MYTACDWDRSRLAERSGQLAASLTVVTQSIDGEHTTPGERPTRRSQEGRTSSGRLQWPVAGHCGRRRRQSSIGRQACIGAGTFASAAATTGYYYVNFLFTIIMVAQQQ